MIVFEKRNESARSLYSLEIRSKIKNFKRMFFDALKTFQKYLKYLFESRLQKPLQLLFVVLSVLVEKNKEKNWNPNTEFLPIFNGPKKV